MPAGLLGIESLDRVEIEHILDRAKRFQPRQTDAKKSDQLRGRMIVNLFFEASTRTRTSFEIAAKRLGADAISITASASSVSKGESLVADQVLVATGRWPNTRNLGLEEVGVALDEWGLRVLDATSLEDVLG